MFEWLETEISAIKTPRFHVVDGPADENLRETVVGSIVPMPTAYKDFVLRFGNARLYRQARNNSYCIGVFRAPREAVLDDGTAIYYIGFHDGASVYIKGASNPASAPIFESEAESSEKVASSFDEWLRKSCAYAKSRYSKKKWAEIIRGPDPFSLEERDIIEARKLIHWRVVRIDTEGNHIVEVTNASKRTLNALTIGVRSSNGRLNGAIRVNVRDIRPGQTALLSVDCYKNIASPNDVELFSLSDPMPEDRDFYIEFNKTK